MKYQEFCNFVEEKIKSNRIIRVKDGIYDVSNIAFIEMMSENTEEVVGWIEERDKMWVANAYNTDSFIFFDKEPLPFKGKFAAGDGFNYGANNVLTGCPDSILIVAEND